MPDDNKRPYIIPSNVGESIILVLSLASYVTYEDTALERVEFLRTVAYRILDDIGS